MKKCQRTEFRFWVKTRSAPDKYEKRRRIIRKLKRFKELFALKKLQRPKAPHNTSQYLMSVHPAIEFHVDELFGSTMSYIEDFLEGLALPD
jgi:hypothetical protein